MLYCKPTVLTHRSPLSPALSLLLAGVLALAGCGSQTPDTAPAAATVGDDEAAATSQLPAAEQPRPVGRLGDAVAPTHYTLDLTIDPEQERFSGVARIEMRMAEPVNEIYLHGNGLDVSSAVLRAGESLIAASYEQVNDTGLARLTLPVTVSAGSATLEMRYSAAFNKALDGLYKVTEDDRAYAFTQFEPIAARRAFPSFDEPRFKVPFDIAVTAPADHAVVTAMPERASETAGADATRHVFDTTPPLPTYLIAFAVGPFDVVEPGPLPANAVRDTPLPLRGITVAGKADKIDYALDNTQPIIDPLEAYFGVPHPYPKLAIIAAPDFAFGAMENVGAIIYREQLLLLNDDASLNQRSLFGIVHAHELAHQWFGNLVTPVWWDDIWLNEAFATWMAYKAADAWRPGFELPKRAQRRALDAMAVDSLASTRQIRQPVERDAEIINAFDSITYRKGGAVLTMFEAFVGETAFRDGVRLHMQRFAHDVATADDFMASIADGSSDERVAPAFRSFLEQPGVPLVSVAVDCESDPVATVSQARYRPLGSPIEGEGQWQIPVCLRTVDADGSTGRACQLVTDTRADIELDTCPAAVMPNADGAGYFRFALDDAGWAALLDGVDALNAREQLALVDSVDAAFRAGAMDFATLRDAARVLADAADWQVATGLADPWIEYAQQFADGATREAMWAELRDLYGPRMQALGLSAQPDEPSGDTLLRAKLVDVLAVHARDTDLRGRLSERADSYIGPADGETNTDALPGDIVESALRVAVAERGQAFADRLWARFDASGDAILRERILAAVANAPADAIAAKARAKALTDALRGNETIQVMREGFANPVTRDASWAWLQANFDAVLERVPGYYGGALAGLPDEFCSAKDRAAVKDFFGPRVDDLQGGPRELAQTLESIDLCIALREASAESIAQVMTAER